VKVIKAAEEALAGLRDAFEQKLAAAKTAQEAEQVRTDQEAKLTSFTQEFSARIQRAVDYLTHRQNVEQWQRELRHEGRLASSDDYRDGFTMGLTHKGRDDGTQD